MPRPRPKSSEPLHHRIARDIGVEIIAGRIAPGETLKTEVQSQHALRVSRSAYREAIRTLSAKGLLETRQKVGSTVTAPARWNRLDPEVLAWSFEAGPTEEFLRGLFELRLIIEPAAAALAAERRTLERLAGMRAALLEMERATLLTREGQAADQRFHQLVLEAAQNASLATLASSIAAAVRFLTDYKFAHGKLTRDPMPDHWRAFDAIAAGLAPEARQGMEALVRKAQDETGAACWGARPATSGKAKPES